MSGDDRHTAGSADGEEERAALNAGHVEQGAAVNAGEVEAARERLRAAGAGLRRRPRAEIIERLADVLDSWRDGSSGVRRALERELATSAGFSVPCVRAGLDHALASWTGTALREVADRELGSGLGEDGARRATGFEVTSVILAGAIPPPTLLALCVPLVLGSPVLAKPSSHDPVTPRLLAASLAASAPDLASCLEVLPLRRDDREATDALLEADCVVLTGSDETLSALAPRVRAPRRLVRFGHRVSVAVLGADGIDRPSLETALERFAWDVALWDQLGCLSPVALFVVGGDGRTRETVAELCATALARAEERWPRGRVPTQAAAAIAAARAEAELRMAAGADVRLHQGPGTSWTVVAEADSRIRPAPLHRFVRIHPVDGVAALRAALGPLASHLAAVGVEGFGEATRTLAHELATLGASRVCPLGRMQAPPLSWCHDNQGVLTPLARFTDLEV